MQFSEYKISTIVSAFFLTVLFSLPVAAVPDDTDRFCSVTLTAENSGSSTQESTCLPTNLLIVVDTSHRMALTLSGSVPSTGQKSRLDLAKQTIHTWLDSTDMKECIKVGLMRTHALGGPILYPVTALNDASVYDATTNPTGVDNRAGFLTDNNTAQVCYRRNGATTPTCTTPSAEPTFAGVKDATKKTVRQRLHELVDQLDTMVNAPITSTMYEAIEYFRGGEVVYGLSRGPNTHGSGGDWTKKVPNVIRLLGRPGGTGDFNDSSKFLKAREQITSAKRIATHVSHPSSWTGGTYNKPFACLGWYDITNSACDDEYISGTPRYVSPVTHPKQVNAVAFLSQGLPDFDDMRWPLFSDMIAKSDGRDCTSRNNSGNRIPSSARDNTYRPGKGGGEPDSKYCTYQKKSIVSATRTAYQNGWMRHWHHQFWDFDAGGDQGGSWFAKNKDEDGGNFWGFAYLDKNTVPYNWDENWWPWNDRSPYVGEDRLGAIVADSMDWTKKDVVDRMFTVREERPEGQACRDVNNEYLQFTKFAACSTDQAEWAYNKSRGETGYTTQEKYTATDYFDYKDMPAGEAGARLTSGDKKPWGAKMLRFFPISYSIQKYPYPSEANVGTNWKWRLNPDNTQGTLDPSEYLRNFAYRANKGGDLNKYYFKVDSQDSTVTINGLASALTTIAKQVKPTETITKTVVSTPIQIWPGQAILGATVNLGDRFANDDRVLVNYYIPGNDLYWKGNIKQYNLSADGAIMGAGASQNETATPLIAASSAKAKSTREYFNANANSNWVPNGAAIPLHDGQEFLDNGAGGVVNASSSARKILTNMTSTPSGGAYTLTDLVANPSDVKPSVGTDLSLTGATLDSFFGWMQGIDTRDEDADSNATERRWPIGAVVNTTPSVLRYGTSSSYTDVAYYGTTAGDLHALNYSTGVEKFTFVPRDMWPHQKKMYDNQSTVTASAASSSSVVSVALNGTGAGPFTSTQSAVDFRGTPNSWGQTPMKRVADNTWATVQTFAAAASPGPRFKVYYGTTWYPASDILVGTNTYWIKFVEGSSPTFGVVGASVNGKSGKNASVSFRGTPNGWGETAMTLVDDFTWETTQTFTANGAFKFYTNSQWIGVDGTTSGGNITLTQPGTYRIRFNDLTYKYTYILGKYQGVSVATAGNAGSAEAMKVAGSGQWELTKTFSGATAIQFYIPESGTWLGGPSPAVVNGGPITVSGSGTYTIVFNETTGSYAIGGGASTSTLPLSGLDGPITQWIKEPAGSARDGLVTSATDKAYIYVGQRRGGRSYYALDVTNPDAPKLLWQLGNTAASTIPASNFVAGLGELGYTWSKPVLTKIRTASGASGITDVLVFGGGYDPNQDAASPGSDAMGRAIYIVNATTGALVGTLGGTTGTLFNAAVTGGLTYSIPGEVAVYDIDRDGIMDHLFAADTGGRLIRADFTTSSSATTVKAAGIIASFGGTGADRRRFFNKPDVAVIELPNSNHHRMFAISVGSGHRGHPMDTATNDMMISLYEEISTSDAENLDTDKDNNNLLDFGESGYPPVVLNNLQNFSDQNASAPAPVAARKLTTAPAGDPTEKRGWYIDLPATGEKVMARALMINHQLLFTTFTPSTSADICKLGGGDGKVYVVDIFVPSPLPEGKKIWYSDELDLKGIPPAPTAIFPSGGEETISGSPTGKIKYSDPIVSVGTEVLDSAAGIEGHKIDFGSIVQKLTWEQQILE